MRAQGLEGRNAVSVRVLLLNPVTRDGTRTLRVGRCQGKVLVGLWPNIEYGYLGALLLERGFEVALLDANHEGLDFRAMLKQAVAFAPDIVFLLSITATVADDIAVGEDLANALPDVRVVYWGTHATARPEDYLVRDGDIALRREIDETGVEVAEALRDGARELTGVAGVSWRKGTELHHEVDRPFVADLDSLPMASHELMGTGTHRRPESRERFALIKTSRGCPHSCVFCTAQCFHGKRWRARSPESIVDEIRHVAKRTGIRQYFLQSDVFSHGRDWTLELCERLLASDVEIQWFCNSRVDNLDAELLASMSRAGCQMVALGIESGSNTVLEAIRKGATREQAVEALGNLRTTGITSLTYYVFGLPGETADTMRETFDFIRRTRPDYAHFYTPTPFPGTKLYDLMNVAERIANGLDPGEFYQGTSMEFVRPGLPVWQVRLALVRAFATFYADPQRILREVRAVHSPDELRGRASTLYTMIRNYLVKR